MQRAVWHLRRNRVANLEFLIERLSEMGKRERENDDKSDGAAKASKVLLLCAVPLTDPYCCRDTEQLVGCPQATAKHPRKQFFRARAHSNPFNDNTTFDVPHSPDEVDWYAC